MGVTNKMKPGIELPLWDILRYAPVASAATSGICGGEGRGSRYLYYLSTTFWRYDTWTDGWQQLATPPITILTAVTIRYTAKEGYRGNCLGAGSSDITIAGLKKDRFNGETIRITSGKGAGQSRVISGSPGAVIQEHGIVTAAGANSIGDSTKKWDINQFIGCQVRLVYGTGLTQVRKVLYNDATTLYFYDANYQQLEPWNNIPFSATAPYALPVTTAALQAHYVIETSVLNVTVPWTTVPDFTSSFVIETGGIFLVTSAAAAPWAIMAYYDVISDTWTSKTAIGGLLIAALGTDFCLETIGDRGGIFLSGNVSAGALRNVTSTEVLEVDRWKNYQIRITAGTGVGQRRKVLANSTTKIFVDTKWDTTPDATSDYEIWGNTEAAYLVGGGLSLTLRYDIEQDVWGTGAVCDIGQCINSGVNYSGQESFAIASGVRSLAGITGINPVPTAGGTGYSVGDILSCAVGGTNGQVKVTSINPGGIVTGLSLYRCGGVTYVVGTGRATTGGTGTSCTFEITSVGTVCRITTVQNHNLYKGDSVTLSGNSEAAYNAVQTTIAVDSLTTFEFITSATANPAASFSQSTSTLVDSTKNWAINEHKGCIVHILVAGQAPTIQSRRVVSNTATVLTLYGAAITAGANGTSRYVITEPQAYGTDEQFKISNRAVRGWATSGSTTTLVDNTKSWIPNSLVGATVRVFLPSWETAEVAITSNTTNTLTYTTQTFTPDAETRYQVLDTFGICGAVTNTTNATITDTTKLWTVNQWAGKRLRITAGTGQAQEITITSNTATVLTLTGVFATAPVVNDSQYSILSPGARGAGTQLIWPFGITDDRYKGRFLIAPRGGNTNVIDVFDLTTNRWDITHNVTPQTELLNTGAMYAYDGKDRLYFTPASATISRVMYLNLKTWEVNVAGFTPAVHGAALIGNRMEVIDIQGVKFIYIMMHTGQMLWRTIIFW